MMRSWIFIMLAIALQGCEKFEPQPPVIVGTVDRNRIELIAESNDRIDEIHVKEGSRVAKDDMVLQQDPALYMTRLQQLIAVRERLQSRLDELQRGPREETILSARARLKGLENELVIQEREYERLLQLVERELTSPSLLDRALELKERTEAARDQARADLDALVTGTTPEEMAQAQAALDEAIATVSSQELLIERLTIRSPVDGMVDELPYESGERPVPGATIAVILEGGLPFARVYIPEPIRSQIRPGTAAEIRVDGVAGPFKGEVRFISSEAAFTPYYALTLRDRSRLNFLAEIDFLGEEAGNLPSGVPLEVRFPSADYSVFE